MGPRARDGRRGRATGSAPESSGFKCSTLCPRWPCGDCGRHAHPWPAVPGCHSWSAHQSQHASAGDVEGRPGGDGGGGAREDCGRCDGRGGAVLRMCSRVVSKSNVHHADRKEAKRRSDFTSPHRTAKRRPCESVAWRFQGRSACCQVPSGLPCRRWRCAAV
jgi:hypothetical protein